jgi:FAD/FMN-containing dehydrogenase
VSGKGVSVNGARSPNPGVGGQTLGGGIGWLTGIAGVTAASLVGAEVVLGNSTIVRVDESHHSDLLWALRGGGPNYGIVTSFTYRTEPIDKVWFAAKLYTADHNQELINALVEYQRHWSGDHKANIVLSLSQDNSTAGSFVGFLYLDPVEYPSAFSPFYHIASAGDMIKSTVGTLSDLSSKFYGPQYPEPGTVPLR